MHDDVNDWKNRLNDNQRDFLTNIFRFFTQGDVDVASAYYTQYLPFFKLPEVTMMMGGFAGREECTYRCVFISFGNIRYA